MNITFGQINHQFEYVAGEGVKHDFPMHMHHTFCVGMVIKGKRLIRLPYGEETIGEGEVFAINAGQPHAIKADDPHDYIAVTTNNIPATHFFCNKIKSSACRGLFDDLLNSIYDKKASDQLLILASLLETLNDFQIATSINKNPVEVIQHAIKFIRQHYQSAITIDDVAEYLCVSSSHFCHLFKQYTGMSPYNYLLQYRIKCSRSLLKKHYSIFDTAIATGFYDSSHYIRHFISYEGVSPGHYQKYFP